MPIGLRQCEHCGVEFTGTDRAQFCSVRCRVASHREKKRLEDDESKLLKELML